MRDTCDTSLVVNSTDGTPTPGAMGCLVSAIILE